MRELDRNEDVASKSSRQQQSAALDSSSSDEELSDKDTESDCSSNDNFEKYVLGLRDYSFISAIEDGKTFTMHNLVQLATRRWLEAKEQQERWNYKFMCRLNVQLSTGAYENWARCQALLPHAVSAAAQRPKNKALL